MEPELTGALAGASFFPGDLQCAPRAIARALAGRAARASTPASRCTAIAVERDRVTGLRTSEGVLPCAAAVIAAGPWSRPLAEAAGVALPLEPRKGQLVRLRRRAPRRAPHPPQGRRGRLPGLGGERRRGPAGDHGARDDVGGRRARGLQPRAPRLRPLRRRRGERTPCSSRPSRSCPACAGCALDAAWAGLRPWLPDQPAGHRAVASAVAGLWLATGPRGRRRRARPGHRPADRPALCGRGAGRRPGAVLARSVRALKERRAGGLPSGPSLRLLKGCAAPSAPPGLRARWPAGSAIPAAGAGPCPHSGPSPR